MSTDFQKISNSNNNKNNNIENVKKILYSNVPNFYLDKLQQFCREAAIKNLEPNDDVKPLVIKPNPNISSNSQIKCLNCMSNNCSWRGQLIDLLSHLSKDCPGKIKTPQKIKKSKNFKSSKCVKCLFSSDGCSKYILKSAYPSHLIDEHYEEIFCSVKKFDILNEEKKNSEQKYKKLLRGVMWADFYQKKSIEKLKQENKILKKKLKEIEEMNKKQASEKEKEMVFEPFLSDNSETKAGFFIDQNFKLNKK